MANVNRSLLCSSGIFQALARDPNISTAPVPRRFRRQPLSSPWPTWRTREHLPQRRPPPPPAPRRYLRPGRPGERVRLYRNGAPRLPLAEDLDELSLLPDEPGGPQL